VKEVVLVVDKVTSGSIADRAGIRPGDRLVKINGHEVSDFIDYQFFSSDYRSILVLERGRSRKSIKIEREEGRSLGLQFRPTRFRSCRNRCIFCFIDQNPPGLRKSLYFKDEDYRLSFLYGNYITLTNVTRRDLDRIVRQHLSPLYISVHATDPDVRKKVLGLERDDKILDKLKFLTENRIELHAQIVLCRGINDGIILERTISDLAEFFPMLRSLSVVPVGLTRYRKGLPLLNGYDRNSSRVVLEHVGRIQKEFARRFGEPFVYLSDEFYLLGNDALPPQSHYIDFWQIENGVGSTRSFIDEFNEDIKKFPQSLRERRHYLIITGELSVPILTENILPRLRKIANLSIEILPVRNRFFGESVTVAGLITGEDIIETVKGSNLKGTLLIPSCSLNGDGLFLDDFTVREIEDRLNRGVVVLNRFLDLFKEDE